MLRDVSSRVKYSEHDIAMPEVEVMSLEDAQCSNTTASSNVDVNPSNMPKPSRDVAVNDTDMGIPAMLPPPTTCPSRALIHKSLRRYYHDVEAKHVSLDIVSDRMLDDLAPFAVLKLGGFALGDLSARLLAAVLRKATSLRTLDLGFNRLSDDGAACLATALARNTSLESLYLSGNNIGPGGAQAIAVALTRNVTMKKLHLSGNNLGNQGVAFLAQGLLGNTGLRSLHLGTNRISASGVKALAAALIENQRLKELTLGQNCIGSEGLQYLARAFATGRVSLTTLELGTNDIGPEGFIVLAKALCGAPNRLQNLYVENNPMGDVGASAFGALLAKTGFLRVLDLSYTQMSLLGLRELSTGLCYSTSLMCLQLDGHDWASTQHMKQPNALNGMTLSAKGAATYAASCVLGAITSNTHSVLCKLTGVDLSFALDELPLAEPDRQRLAAEISFARMTRPADSRSRNDLLLQFLRDQKTAVHSNKRKSDASLEEAFAHDPETAPPRFQRQRTLPDEQSIRLPTVPDAAPAGWRATTVGASSAVSAPLGSAQLRVSLPHIASLHRPKGWSASSPRYDALETHARKVLAEIAKMPFDSDESDMLQAYYLGGCSSPKLGEDAHSDGSNGSIESLHSHTSDQVPCPACQASRLARYRRTMVVKHKLETMENADVLLLVLLRRLHYLITVFRRAENADDRIDGLLVSMYSGLV